MKTKMSLETKIFFGLLIFAILCFAVAVFADMKAQETKIEKIQCGAEKVSVMIVTTADNYVLGQTSSPFTWQPYKLN